MTTPQFLPLADSPLYQLTVTELDSTVCEVAFLPFQDITAESLTLAQTWNPEPHQPPEIYPPGVYLFLKGANALAEPTAVAERVRSLLQEPALQQTRFLWVDNPTDPLPLWNYTALTIAPTPEPTVGTVGRLTFFRWRNYGVAIARGIECRLNTAEDGFILAPGTPFPETVDPFYLSTGYGAKMLKGIEQPITLPFSGAQAGCLQFTLTLKRPFHHQTYPELTALDLSLRMFFKEPEPTFAPPRDSQEFMVASHRHPLLGEEGDAVGRYGADLVLDVALDPLNPLNGDRTRFTFPPPTQDTPAPDLPSGYRTNLGYTIHLTPQANAGLVFAERPVASSSIFDAPFYLVPVGDFVLSVPRYEGSTEGALAGATTESLSPDDNLLCGLSGVEYIKIQADHTHRLCFRPGQAAFIPTFQPKATAAAATPTDSPTGAIAMINDRAKTAWAFVSQLDADQTPTPSIYFSQPDLSILYQASTIQDDNPNAQDNLLSFLEVPATGLPGEEDGNIAFPMLPYGGVQGNLIHYQQLEQQYVNPARRSRIVELSQTDTTMLGTPGEADKQGVTPQGFLTTYSSNFETLKSILLAKDTAGAELKFENLPRHVTPQAPDESEGSVRTTTTAQPQSQPQPQSPPLRDAFQSNQMFLVISDPASFQNPETGESYFQSNRLTIQGWTFDLDPETWRQDTVLIFKFFDKPLLELIADETLWSFKGEFNVRSTIRAELISLFQEVQTRGAKDAAPKDRENYEYLARAIALESWSGILALNVKVPPNDIPGELKALVGGINEEEFFAQYVVIETTPVLPQDGKLEPQQSSLFALIDYQDESIPTVGPEGYAFQVSMLRVLFQNSQIKAFSSEINLTVDQLFRERTRLLNSRTGRNLVVLKGTAENQDGQTKYSFSFNGENYFAMPDSHVLDHITIVKSSFTTDPLPEAVEGKIKVTGRFILWGQFNFRRLDKFDAFSFGANVPLKQVILKKVTELSKGRLAEASSSSEDPTTRNNLFISEGVLQQRADEILKHNSSEKATLASSSFFERDSDRQQRSDDIQALDAALAMLQDNEQGLPFAKVLITMTFDLDVDDDDDETPQPAPPPSFTFDASELTYDLKQGQFRRDSLYGMFPIQLLNFVQITEQSKPSGFMAVKNPLGSGSLPAQGYGFIYQVNLGSLGALAGSAQFVVKLLLAWTPNTDGDQDSANVFVGLQLPGIGGDVLGFPLQSVLKLSFKSLEFVVDRAGRDATAPIRGYLMKLRNLALKILVLSLPPSGQTELIIFGNPRLGENPDLRGKPEAVGWYAAYAKDPAPPSQGSQPGSRASPARPR